MSPKEIADELAQQVFLKAFDKLNSFRGEAPFGAWLCRIAFNTIRDWHRVERRAEVVTIEGVSVPVHVGYDEALSHRLFAGADAVLVPSRFEPCGLTQMYGLRYGTLPVVSLVGGLADTVIGASPAALAAGVATGITFQPVDGLAFGRALTQLLEFYRQPKLWAELRANAMAQPVGWEASAAAYAGLYERLIA